jgi:hypothetical protein
MRVKEFISMLQSIDPKIRFVPGPGKQSGIYKFEPKHPDAHPNGLRWIAACPSPHMFFGKLSEFDWIDMEHNANEYHRGWRKILNLIVAQGNLRAADVTRMFGYKWRYHSKEHYAHRLNYA